MQNLFFSMVHCKPNLEVFIKRLVTTEPTKDWCYIHNFSENFETSEMQKTLYSKISIECLKGTVSSVNKLLEFQLTWTSDRQIIFEIGFVCVKIPAFPRSDA